MPEGPEIRAIAREFDHLNGRRITKATVLSGRYMRNPIVGLERLIGRVCFGVTRRGKLIVLSFDDDTSILTTAGMSGYWVYGPTTSKFQRIRLEAGDHVFTFIDMRNFGTFKIVTHAEAWEKIQSLGVDVFDDSPNITTRLISLLHKYAQNQPIAEALLDQRIFAGVGNYIRADAMYLAGIDPRKMALDLTPTELQLLWNAVRTVAEESYDKGSEYFSVCYGRTKAADGSVVKSYTDKNGRTVWHV